MCPWRWRSPGSCDRGRGQGPGSLPSSQATMSLALSPTAVTSTFASSPASGTQGCSSSCRRPRLSTGWGRRCDASNSSLHRSQRHCNAVLGGFVVHFFPKSPHFPGKCEAKCFQKGVARFPGMCQPVLFRVLRLTGHPCPLLLGVWGRQHEGCSLPEAWDTGLNVC